MTQRHPLGLNDITCIAPPCLTPQRAQAIYRAPFLRAIEFISHCKVIGSFLEFGTYHGYTARTIAECMRRTKAPGDLYLFDSWEGFPEMTGGDKDCPEVQAKLWNKGDCAPAIPDADKIIKFFLEILLPKRVHTVKGFYEDTVPEQLPEGKASLVHIDCDLYESTHHVLKCLVEQSKLQQGTVLMFDDWNNNFASQKFGERAAVADLFPYFTSEVWRRSHMHGGWSLEPWFNYGFSGQSFIVHKE